MQCTVVFCLTEENALIVARVVAHVRGFPSLPSYLGGLGVSYVQIHRKEFYFLSSCSQDDERSEESCEHDDRPTTDCVSARNGRRQARSKPASCRFARTDV
jgi:hypothetical protein